MQNTDYRNFKDAVARLVGQPCSVVAGTAGVGSMVMLYFGDTFLEVITLPSFGTSTHEHSVLCISLSFAAWRCRAGAEVLCSSSSRNGVGSAMEVGLSKLKGRLVERVCLAENSLDLSVFFEGGFAFEIFCDQADIEDEPHDNYSFRSPDGWHIVGPGCRLGFEPHYRE